MRSAALALSFVLLLGAGCNKASDKQVDELIVTLNEVWTGYLKVLADNRADPARALAEGQRYIDEHQDRVDSIAAVFHMKGTQAQIDKVKRAYDTNTERVKEALAELAADWALEARQKLSDQVVKFDAQMKAPP
jgi:hypothetical protein